MPETTRDVFFYGLFMDDALLRDKGIEPRAPRRAVASGYRLVIGRRAMLARSSGARAFGMVYALTDRELESLYAEPGLEMYRPEPLTVAFEDGAAGAVTTFNLADVAAAGERNSEYAARLEALIARRGFQAGDAAPALSE